ncbi:MAG TPA: hypothetical protein PKL28_04405 [Rhodocyclaceae bacterium]|nr:hypothetical protein [Rhodocyclaceae bacterium]HNM80270.1 hypothetical protein [Rhodocyclaceae bacterium]
MFQIFFPGIEMGNEGLALKTNGALLEALKNAASKKPSAREVQEQRVSFVLGSMSSKSSVTREHIRQVIDEQEGLAA